MNDMSIEYRYYANEKLQLQHFVLQFVHVLRCYVQAFTNLELHVARMLKRLPLEGTGCEGYLLKFVYFLI